MFLQIHTLTSYPASLLNRDDAGLAKRIPFGNAARLRISSQCLKRHWREALTENLPDLEDGLRTRSFFTRAVLPRLTDKGLDPERAQVLTKTLAEALIKGGLDDKGEMSQPVLFGLREADYFVDLILRVHGENEDTETAVKVLKENLGNRDQKANIKAMCKSAAGLTAALFGRFVTSDILARVDAPVHVAHAFTVHAAQTEMDYFTVIDDLQSEEETGAAHANEMELGAGVYYSYVVVDIPLLVSNLTGVDAAKWRQQPDAVPRKVLTELITTTAVTSPGAKLGATAPYSRAEWVLLETGYDQPRTLANAFLEAVPMEGSVLGRAIERVGDYVERLDTMYGPPSLSRSVSTIHDGKHFESLTPKPLKKAITEALGGIWS